jgi:sialic acid synthase SpsE
MMFPEFVIGYSGHEPGLWTTLCAVAMGAKVVERHITLDRAMKGSDQSMSIEPAGFKKLVSEIRTFEKARGSGEIRVLECEQGSIARLRNVSPFNGASQDGPVQP